jgi:hypothetical protein
LSLWLLGSVQAWAARTKVQPGWLWNYEGHIAGQHGVRMTLVFGSGEITGVYFHASQLKDIALRGRMLDATRVVLEELDAAAEQLLVDYERIFTLGVRQAIAQGCRATCSCATRAPCWAMGRCGLGWMAG